MRFALFILGMSLSSFLSSHAHAGLCGSKARALAEQQFATLTAKDLLQMRFSAAKAKSLNEFYTPTPEGVVMLLQSIRLTEEGKGPHAQWEKEEKSAAVFKALATGPVDRTSITINTDSLLRTMFTDESIEILRTEYANMATLTLPMLAHLLSEVAKSAESIKKPIYQHRLRSLFAAKTAGLLFCN